MKKYFFFFYLISSSSFANQITLECNISEEFENDKPARKKIYESEPIDIFLNKYEKWINDKPTAYWLKDDDLKDRVITFFKDKNEKITFNFKKFQSIEKKKIESSFDIHLEKTRNFLEFIKYYYEDNGNIYFSTEIKGNCVVKK
ncbi:MAG: hypothetical protein CMM95_00280 [Rickettsiales bacterium]|nr:hypothetical protein [Rickettsiales bacterium]|tara:strand:- start:29 stop:460 length:432 start_codon:yes stop_codon:yes gene_type:complete